jgi:hypothetical protein
MVETSQDTMIPVRDQYLGLPLGEAVLDLVEQSYAELRALL